MASSVEKRLCCSPGLLCHGCIILVWTLQESEAVWNQRDKGHLSCSSCWHTLVGSKPEVSGFVLSPKLQLEKQFPWLCSWWFHYDYRVCWTSCGVVGKQVPWRAKRLHCVLPQTAPGDYFSPSLAWIATRASAWNKSYRLLIVVVGNREWWGFWEWTRGQGEKVELTPGHRRVSDVRWHMDKHHASDMMTAGPEWWLSAPHSPFQGCQSVCHRGPCVWRFYLSP